ncbi:MAG: metallophosphoesterase [Nitrospirae bacterium]|nr:metallophosphoesterase [Nitrospirota bacterium]
MRRKKYKIAITSVLHKLKEFSDAAEIKNNGTVVPVFVIPGNHDLRTQGMFIEDNPIIQIVAKMLTEVATQIDTKLTRFIKVFSAIKEIFARKNTKNTKEEEAIKLFEEIFTGYKTETDKLSAHKLLIGCFNSNRTHKDYDFSKGFVAREDFNSFNNYMQTKFTDDRERLKYKKIALLHHHPMPISVSETESSLRESYESSFLILANSATFMSEMLKNNITLILHGHKHFSGFSKTSFLVDPAFEIRRTIGVISAGSVSPEEKTLSYNIIEYYDSGEVILNIKEASGAGNFYSKPPVKIFTYEEVRQNTFIECMNIFNTISEKTSFHFTIEQPGGDRILRVIREGIITHKEDKITEIQGLTSTTNGLLGGPHKIIKGNVTWKPIGGVEKDESIHKYMQRWEIIFDFPLRKGGKPIEYEIESKVPNSFSFSKEERVWDLRSQGVPDDDERLKEPIKENMSLGIMDHGYKNLFLQVKFPDRFKPAKVDVIVKEKLDKNEYRINNDEQEYCRNKLSYFEEANTVTLFVDNTLIDHKYIIEWDLPEKETYSNINLHQLDVARKIQEGLRKLRNNPKCPYKLSIDDLLLKLKNAIVKYIEHIEDSSLGDQNSFELSILVLNEESHKEPYKYQYAITNCEAYCDNFNGDDDDKKDDAVIHGHPVVGVAAKCKFPAWVIPMYNKEIEDISILKKTCNLIPNGKFYAIIAIPLFFPVYPKQNLIGVVELASCSDSTILRYLKNRDNDKTEKNMNALQFLLHGDFIKGLCKTILCCRDLNDKKCEDCMYQNSQ